MSLSIRLASAAALLTAPAALMAAWVPGSELVGQSARVETGGVTNTISFDAGGRARIASQGGSMYDASWTASKGQLCLYGNGASECWPYQQAFRAGEVLTLTSNCAVQSRWLAENVNALPPEPPPQIAPERG